MKILITGASGFIGRHLVEHAQAAGHEVIGVALAQPDEPFAAEIEFIATDIFTPGAAATLPVADVLVHLAWQRIPEGQSPVHMEICLPQSLTYLKETCAAGLRHLLVVGTCFEYGQQREGMLSENDEAAPECLYSQAKHQLHRELVQGVPDDLCLHWARLFYTYGPHQHQRCLLPLLEAAIARGDTTFPMSPGQQERDYIHVHDIAAQLLALTQAPEQPGTYNICSGKPTKVIDLVRRRCTELNSEIELDTTAYPYRAGEVMSNWGDKQRISAICEQTGMTAAA